MTYTCACYPTPDATLEEAQENKYRPGVREAAACKPGDRLLDVGCGWGGMVRYAARHGVQAHRRHAVAASRPRGRRRRSPTRAWPTSPRCATATTATSRETGFDAVSLDRAAPSTSACATTRRTSRFLQSTGCAPAGCCSTTASPGPTTAPGRRPGGFIDRYVFPDGELTGSGPDHHRGAGRRPRGAARGEPARALRADPARLVRATSSSTGTRRVAEVGLATARVWGLYMAGSRLGFETQRDPAAPGARGASPTTTATTAACRCGRGGRLTGVRRRLP